MTRKPTNLPKISIVIPSYNKADYIRFTLQSIVNQRYPNLEVVIQDGGSTDGTIKIIKEFADKYPEIFLWNSKQDKGQVDAINIGLNCASGSIICYINADDVYDKNALIEVGTYFLNNPDTLWLIGYGNIINTQGKVISPVITSYKHFLLKTNNYKLLLVVNYISQPSVFLSAKAYKKFGPFTGTKKYVMEYALWLKLGSYHMPAIIKRNLSSFRLTMENISSTFYSELLSLDYQIASNFTNNYIILVFHRLHNLSRVGLISVLKSYEKFLAW